MGNYWLSKSKIMDGLQCEKRLWMEMHQPEEGEFSEATERLFSTGHRVGEVARTFFPGGVLIDTGRDLQAAIDKTRELLARPGDVTLFEPAFEHQGVLARADVLVRKPPGCRHPVLGPPRRRPRTWHCPPRTHRHQFRLPRQRRLPRTLQAREPDPRGKETPGPCPEVDPELSPDAGRRHAVHRDRESLP